MKTLAILSTIVLCSCAELGPFEAVTKFGSFKQDDKGQITIIPVAKPIVINPSK